MTPKRVSTVLTPEERLQLHQQRSGPVMEQLHHWLEAQFAEQRTEPNSGLGKAITYLLRHWRPLTTVSPCGWVPHWTTTSSKGH